MNSEIIERLILDRALGQLPPDVEALLQEILAANPPAARLAAEYRETAVLAASSLKRSGAIHGELPPRVVVPLPRRPAGRWLALAASFILGAGVAVLLLPERNVRMAPSPAPAIAPVLAQAKSPGPANPPPAIEREVRSLPFWSTRRAYLLAAAARQTNPSAAIPQ